MASEERRLHLTGAWSVYALRFISDMSTISDVLGLQEKDERTARSEEGGAGVVHHRCSDTGVMIHAS